MDVEYFEQVYLHHSAEVEISKVEEMALAELGKNNRLQPTTVLFGQGIRILLPLHQFENQEEAKQVSNQLLREKNCDFYITAGMSRNNHPYDASQDQFWLNLIINNKDKISYVRVELLLTKNSDGKTNVTVLKRETHGIVSEEKEVSTVKDVYNQEKLTDEDTDGSKSD